MKRALLVMPVHFYSFARTFERELAALGYQVTLANEEYPANLAGRIGGKLDLGLIRWWTRRVFTRRFLSGARWDLVLIVKGRGIGPALVADLKRHADRVVGYHFDSLGYDRATRRWGGEVDRVSTFDFRDAREQNWPLVELFSATAAPEPVPPVRWRLSAIQRNHSQRLAYLDTVIGAVGAEDTFVFLYEQNRLALVAHALRHPRLYWKWRKRISLTPLAYEDYVAVLAASEFTLDYAHPGQTGTTMRCFEALALGVKVITNNADTAASPRFGDDNLILFPPDGDPAALRQAMATRSGYRRTPQRRTAADVVAEILTVD